MRRLRSVVPLLCLAATPLAAQSNDAERQAVLATVHRLFDGMRKGDSSVVRSVFHPQAFLATALVRQGIPVVQVDTVEAFVRAVGTPHDEDGWRILAMTDTRRRQDCGKEARP